MDVNQIYSLVNSVVSQGLGRTDLTVVDDSTLVALGNTVLSSTTNTDTFTNTLVQRIGAVINDERPYSSKFKLLYKSDMEYGAILQKIKVLLPSAEEDQSFGLQDGASVDMQKINKPKVVQKFFTKETPWQIHITIQRRQLMEAFTSSAAMGGFISAIFTQVQNAIELSLEQLGRTCMGNAIAETVGTSRAINLVATYLAETGKSITAKAAKTDEAFLRWAIGYIKRTSTRMTEMSNIYNDGTVDRFTPYDLQRMFVLSDWQKAFETQVQYAAFNEKYVRLEGFEELSYWQSIKTPGKINVKRASDSMAKTLDNVVAVLFDRDAIGTYKNDFWTATAPFNAAGGYTNTYYHAKNLYFNDMSENFVTFYLEDAPGK